MADSDHRQKPANLWIHRLLPMPEYHHPLRIFSVFVFMCLSSQAFGQLGGSRINRPLSDPTISPYLNLLRNSDGPGFNYFGLVRPQLDAAQQSQQFGQNLQMLQSQQNQGMRMVPGTYGYSQLGMTGHPVIFNSFSTGQFSGGYTGTTSGGFGGGGFGGGGFGGGSSFGGGFGGNNGLNGGFNQSGGQSGFGGFGVSGVSPAFSGVSGHPAQFGGIGNSSQGSVRGR